MEPILPDHETCYRALSGRDARFDGWFFAGITSTGIYCRPSCPARTPKESNCRWFPTAAAAQAAGFRACRRCLPDAVPGSPAWHTGTDVASRAMRLIADGLVDREGVPGLASALGYSSRQLQRLLVDHAGAGPLALARSQRAHTARVLLQRTERPITEVAFQSGFRSVRQFNQTIREVYGQSPTQLRERQTSPRDHGAEPGGVVLRLPAREPFDSAGLLEFLAARTVLGLEAGDPTGFARSVVLPRGVGVVRVKPERAGLRVALHLEDWRDLAALVARVRAWFDLDADPIAIDRTLARNPILAGRVAQVPGIRIPGTPDPGELAVRCLVGQQISLQGAVTIAGRLVERWGAPLPPDLVRATRYWGLPVERSFPSMAILSEIDPEELPMPRARARAVVGLAAGLASGHLLLHPGVDREEARRALLQLPGIGPWTAGYVLLRAVGDPDVLLDKDLVVARVLSSLPTLDPQRCAPWRSYLTLHLWRMAAEPAKEPE